MNFIHILLKYLITVLSGCLLVNEVAAQEITVDFRDPVISPNQICFDVYLSRGANYGTQIGGEWTSLTITFNIDVASITPAPGPVTLSNNAVFTNVNNAVIDPQSGTHPLSNNNPPGSPSPNPPYDFEYRITLDNASMDPLPVTPVRAVSVCVPVLGGTITTDDNSDVQMRTATNGAGSFWSNGVVFSQQVDPADPNNMDPLPIELVDFKVLGNKCDLRLQWETATEQNLGFYQIEQSKDGRHFKPVGQVKPQSPNSTTPQVYHYAIPSAYHNHYFRLKAVDLDQAVEYSPVVYAQSNCHRKYGVSLYPNPNYTPTLTVEIDSPEDREAITVQLLDVTGKTIYTQRTALSTGLNRIALETAALPAGTYFVKVLGINGWSAPIKFVRTTL